MEKKYINILITGGSRGIGFEILKKFYYDKNKSYKIYFTSTCIENAKIASNKIEKLKDINSIIIENELEMNNKESIDKLIEYYKNENILFDYLILNAGIASNRNMSNELFQKVLNINYFNNKYLLEKFIENKIINKNNTCILFISSVLGKISRLNNKNNIYYEFLKDYQLNLKDEDKLNEIINKYLKDSDHLIDKNKWPFSPYAMSKMFLTLYSFILHLNGYISFSCCPGWCKTDLTKGTNASKEPELAAKEIYDLINHNKIDLKEKSGNFYYNGLLSDFTKKII